MSAAHVKLGTRGSQLALAQSRWVKERLEASWPGLRVDLVSIRTRGDKIQDVPLYRVGGKGLFLKEIEEALLRKEIDLAVHSVKDIPADLPSGLYLAAIPEREDPRDVLVSRCGLPLEELPPRARVGTSSLRRQAQLMAMRPDLQVCALRGNVDTRLRKLEEAQLDALILASAGLRRLGLLDRATQFLDPEVMIPAIGQGALGLECRMDDPETNRLIRPLDHGPSSCTVAAERAFLRRLEGGCQVPVAANALLNNENLFIRALVGSTDGKRVIRGQRNSEPSMAEPTGKALAEELLERGAEDILREIYKKNDMELVAPP
ncbi:MAG: hydroxymethylbilane synthase [Deltaproteobacteria bacterium]|nr:hydroxymethylbilane synthase [Deltaproteobacteria bacterium]MBW2306866.1 hydroxymethylbilane synthase [Deltaproteobacteria bacterium]